MSARDTVLAKIRSRMKVTGNEADRIDAVSKRLQSRPLGILPERGKGDEGQLVSTFISHASSVSAEVTELDDPSEIPSAVSEFLRDKNLPQAIIHGYHPEFKALPWQNAPALERQIGKSAGQDQVGLSWADAGVAETGTIALASGARNPTTINFLPDTHIVVVKRTDIVGHYESIWPKLEQEFGKSILPRTVNFITGPSRSGDIEQTILLGAHGPRALKIFVVGSS